MERILSDEELEDLWNEAEQAFKNQDWERAEPLLVKVAAVNPRYQEVQRLLSRTRKYLTLLAEYRRLCALEDNQWREAQEKFALIRRENPNFPDKLHLLEWIEAQEWCEHQNELAREYFDYGQNAEARQILTEILKRQPDNQTANRLLADVMEVEEEAKYYQEQAELKARNELERRQLEISRHHEAVRKDVILMLFVVCVLAALVIIVGLMQRY
jgi:hypothetical protein